MFLRITMKDGETFVSEFTKLANAQRYAIQVFAGIKPFNVWKVVGNQHPASGEHVLVRQRVMLNGRDIASIEHVERVATQETNSLEPNDFAPVAESQSGPGGSWVAPAVNTPEHAVAGVRYPVHIHPQTLVPYVILRAAYDQDGQRVESEEVQYALQAAPPAPRDFGPGASGQPNRPRPPGPADGDDDILPEEFEQE